MYLTLILLAVFAVCVAFNVNSGIWTNALTLINAVTAALIATNYFEPLADYLDGKAPAYTYAWDFLSIWLLFAIVLGLMRAATDQLSKVKVKFRRPVDKIGGILTACLMGWVMVCFTTMTLHTAPLARNFLGGEFQDAPDARMFLGLGPDRRWLGFVRHLSRGPYSRSGDHVFDEHGDLIAKYGERRAEFEKQDGLSVAR